MAQSYFTKGIDPIITLSVREMGMKCHGALYIIKGALVLFAVFALSVLTCVVLVPIIGVPLVGTTVMQTLFILLPLREDYSILGLRAVRLTRMIAVFTVATCIASLLAYAELHITNSEQFKSPIPGIEQNPIQYFLIALALAPTGEETLFRGLFLGYMLRHDVNPWLTIIVSATLFSFMHMLPFHNAPITQQAFILAIAFLMSIIAGYLRKQTGSLLLAIITHVGFNLGELYGSYYLYRGFHNIKTRCGFHIDRNTFYKT